ncbi:microtubule-actin cross-linking factor 1, isoforms 1/2/3/4/5-like isoform X3 [Tachypleus tridentatus]|uniref:microtubule-actin cross-linking factor 1, isoforms 1/2/3/4/5-like isoform X3 n=1 Tax=Tachypleus tridentatus TaxID=6853 RepID=UPI003FD39421
MSVDQTRPAGLGKERASYIFKWWEGPQPILVAALKWELVISALKAASITSIVLALGITLLGTYLFTNSGTARPEEPGCTLLQSPLAGRQFTCEAKNHCPLDWIPSLAAVVTLVDVFFAALFGGLLVLSSSNMHSRRHLKGSRQLPEPDTLVQSSSSTSSQEFRSSFSSSEVRTLQTSRVIRKTTTMVQGGDQHTVTTNVVSPGRTTTTQHVIKQESSSVGRTDRTDKTQKVQSPIKSLTSRKVPATTTPGNKRITTKTVEKIQKKQKISDIIGQTDETISARDALLNWAQHTTDLYPGVTVIDFTSSWRDGLAFNAIIHRNRPDLIDWRSMRANSPHENLELAFSIMEREYGVTRLLDPEDVDTLEPDEKSLITYVSSLYDVFPEPPAYHPFADNDKLRKLEEYTELASILHLWMRETIMMFQDRTFPNTLVEMKAYLAECNRFRVEDIPQRLHDKQKLSSLYKDLQKLFRETGSVEIESELEIDTIERNWNRLMIAHQERDQAVHDEINRLEKLQRLAEKLHREAKQCDGKLDDIDKRIAEEEKRVQRLHPTDAIYICDQIEAELKLVEENIQVMFQDVDTLRDGRYHQTHELYKRVQNIQQRWLNIRLNFTSRLLTPLSSRTYKTEERQVTKQRQIVSERRLVETNDAFKVLQECLDWVNGKLKLLYAAEYGSDLSSVKSLLENHQLEHQSIDQFHVNIDQCATKKHQFQGDEQELYYRLFSKLEKGYTELVVMSNKRLTDLETLLDFIQSATNELMWMNKKEEIEVTRDWSSKTLDIVEIEQYQETLTSDLEKREIQFNAVTDRGQSLQLQKHPATECIEAYLAAMQSQWSWLLQLTICLEEHLKHSSAYHQFFTESRECEQWLGRIEDRLNTTFSRKTFPIDEGERLLMQMLELREDMMHYKNIVFSLVDRSKEIVPLKQRRQHLSKPLQVIAICSYKQLNMTVSANEHCWLHDNSQKIKWKVINSAGTEGMVPGVCFVIPPPNAEAVDLAQSLNKKFDNVLTLWSKKHHKLRQNMIFSTVRVIKSWDFTTFRSMEPAQRESIQRALKEDGQKLVDEGDTNDPDLKRLQDEINICNKLFQDFVKRLKGDEVDRTLGSRFTDLISSLQNSLNEKEKILQNRSQEPIPRDLDTLDTQVMDHKEFETDLKSLEPQIEEMKDQFQSMAKKSPVLQNRHDTVIEIWERTWTVSHLYIERLKSVEIILNVLDEATSVVTQMEIQLVKYENLSADMTTLSKTHEQLMKLQGQIQQGQNVIDQLNNDLTNVQRLTECTRPKQLKHPDIKKLEDDVKKITKRWDNGCSQVVERLRSCEAASELVRTYRTKLDKDEQPWMNQMFTRIKKLKPVKSMTPQQAEKEVQNIVEFYNSVSQRKSSIEHTNTLGGRYVREAKIYDLRLKHYSESLEEVHPSLDASIPKKAKVVVGADVISQELDVLNKQYTDVVDKILQYLNELREYLSGQKDYKCSITISRAVPITPRSFRSELIIDQASMQEPMDMDDRYYSVQEGYTTLTYTTQDKVIPEQGTESRKYFTMVTEPTTVLKQRETTQRPSEDLSSSQKKLAGTSMTIKEVRNTKRLEKTDQVPSTEYIIAVRGIANPKTGELLTMTEAIKLGILNINTGQYTDLRTDKRMSLQDAVSKGLIDGDFVNRITEVCGINDVKTGIELTLIEAIQKELFDPDKGTFIDPKQRIPITIDEAIHCGIIREDKVQKLIEMKIVKISKLTITEAVQKGLLDPQTGQFRDPKTHQLMSLKEAFERGFLEVEVSVYSEGGIALAEAIDRGMVNDKAGQIVDKDSGERFTIDEAINRGIIRRDVREVVNTQSEEILSVPQSISQNVINAQSGRYINKATQERLTFQQAYDKQFILRPLTLKDAYELELLDETGRVTNPVSKQKLTILDAIAKGILNTEVKSIIHPQNEELLTLPEALEKGVLTPHGQFVDSTGELISLSQAVNKGLITSVCHKMIFDIEGIKNPVTGDNISFNNAVSKGFIDLKTGSFTDTTKGETMTFEEATTRKFIQPQITEMMNKKIGVKDDKGKELTILQAVFKGLLDAKTGQVREPRTKKPLPLKEAIEKNIITPEGAAILKSLLNITVTLATVTKTITRYVTVTSQGVTSDVKITFQDAMKRGLIDETHGTFKEPNTGEIMPLEEAINRGILGLTSEWPTETPHEIPGYPAEPYTTGFRRTTITHKEEISPLPEKQLLPTVSKKSRIESYTKELPISPQGSSKKGPSAHEYPKKDSPGKESPKNKEEYPIKEPTPQSRMFPIKDISEPTNENARPKKPSLTITPDEYQPAEDKSYVFKQVLKHDITDVKFPEDNLETQEPSVKPSVTAKEEPGKGRQPSLTKEEPGKGRQPSPTKEEPGKGRQPSPTKEEPGKGRQPSPTKEEPGKGRQPSPTKEEPGKGRQPSPTKEEPGKGRQPSPTKEEPVKGRQPSSAKEKPGKGRLPSPTKEEPSKGRRLSPTKEELGKERQPSPTKEEPGKGRQPSPTKEEPGKGRQPSPTKEEPDKERQPSPTKEEPGKERQPSPTKEEPGKERQPSPTKEEPGKGRQPSPTKEEPGKGRQPSPTKEEPGKGKQPSPTKEEPGKGRQPSPTKEEPGKERQPSPTKEEPDKERQPSPTKEELDKGRKPSPTKEEPGKGRQPSPTKEEPGKGRQPSPTKEEPGKGRQPSPTKEEPGKGRQPSPTKEEPGKGRQSSPTKEEPGKGRQLSPTKEEPSKGRQPFLTKEEPDTGKLLSPSKEEPGKGRQPSPAKVEPSKGRQPLPAKEEPSKGRQPSPAKEEPSKGRQPSPTKDEPSKGRQPSPTKEEPDTGKQPSLTKEQPVKGRQPSPTKLEPFRGRKPFEDELLKTKEPSLLPSKEEPVKERKLLPTREEPIRGRETLPIKEKPSPTRDEPTKDRKPSLTKEDFKGIEPSLGKVQPVKERTPSPTKEEPTKEAKPWSSKSVPFKKDVKGLTSQVKVEKPDDEPLNYTDKPEKQPLSITIEEHQRETISLIIEPQKKTYRPSSPSKEPDRKISFPSKEEPTEECTSAPTKEEPERKVKFPTKEVEKRTPSSVKEESVKGRTPSLSNEEPKRKISSPTKEQEKMTPSPTKEIKLKEPERKVSSPVREPDKKTPSPTRESLTRKKSSSPSKEEPEVITSLAKEPEEMTPSSPKEQPFKGKTPSSTKRIPEDKLPSLAKEKPEEKLSLPVKESDNKYPFQTKELSAKEKTPSPPKEEPERYSNPVKESERRYPSSKETPLKGRIPSPVKDQPDRKYPLSSKEPDRKTPLLAKEIPFNGRSPTKEEPEKKTRPFIKEPEVESPKSLSPKKLQSQQKPEISHIAYTNGTNGVEETTVTSFITKHIETFEVPPDGWFLKEAIDQKLFDTETGLFTIPGTDRLVSFEETIRLEIINPKSASVVEPSTKRTVSLLRSLEKGILDSTGHYVDSKTKGKINMKEAIKKKLIILEDRIDAVDITQRKTTKVIHITQMGGQPDKVTMVTEGGFDKPVPTHWGLDVLSDIRRFPKTAVEEKYKLSGDNILKLLRWIEEVEGRLADLDQVHENITELQKQIARARDIKDDLDDHQRPVATCLDKVRQIVQQGADVLSKEEIEQLQKDSNELKKRYDKICEESEKLLRRLSSSQEELDKFNVELQTFKKWLIEAEQKLHEQEKDLGDVKNLKENSETFKTFMNDVIAHQADLRFITMIAQKFIDESKDYLKILNNFRTNLPRRRAHVEPKESEVKTEVSEVSTTYHNLLNRVNRLSEKFSRVIEKERYYVECLEKATVWLQDVRRSSFKLLDEPIAAEPRAIHDQLNRIKTISLDIVGQSRLIENTKQSGKFLIEFLEGTEVSFTEIQIIEETLQTLEDDYYTLSNDISEKCNELQTALVQSQDIQDGLDHLLKWLDETENTFRTQNKAISLIRERLDEQIREHKVLQTDIDSQKPSISAVTNLAKDLTDSSNQRLAKKVESKMKDINTRFEKLCEKSRKRGELLDEVVVMVKTFEVMIVRFEEWIQVITETVESREIIQLSTEEYISRIEEAINQRTAKKDDFDEIVKTGKNLVSKRDVTDTTPTKDKVKSLEQQWKDLGDSLTEKQRAGKTRAQQQFAYETLRAKVLEWLANIENRVEELNVVAIDQNVLQQQAAETKLLIKEHTDYAPTVDKVNDLGNSYDAILHGEQGDSPRRRAGSPTKKVASSPSVAPSSPTKKSPSSEYTETRRSPDVQSPTHAKFIQSPLSTVSSGFSSQRSSADNLRGVEDLSPVQQQLSEINNRYSLLGVKLSDRHQEIETLTEEVKRHLETIRILLTFIKAKEKQLPQEALPENKEQAEKQLLLLKTIQEEVQEKQPDMDRVKAQTQDLLRKKPNVLGSDNLRNQINELVSRWSELIEVTKQQLDLLQGFKDFQDTHDIVTNWLIQKDKMLQVLGPIASEPRMVTSQMQQVQVMREEFRCQQSLLNRLDSSGQAVIDSLGPASPASTKVQDQMDTIHRTWEDLLRRLADREKSLDAACGVTKEFHDTLNRLHVCLQDIGDNFDQLSESSYDIVQQLNTLNDLEGQLESQRPHLAGAESVCEELCEILSDTTSKTEIKTKFITLQKQFFNLTKKIDNRKAELESSQKEDQEFYSSCENIKIWLDKMQDNLSKTLNISADRDILTEQLKDFQPLYRDVLDKEHEVHILLSKGNDVVNKITNKTEALQLKNKLDTIKIQWDTIRKDAHDRQNRLQRCADTSRRFHSALAEFIPWLEECERKLDSLQPISFQRTELDKQVKDIQAFKNELSRHSQEFDNICNFGEVLLDQTDVDQQDVQQQLNELKEHWDRLNQGVLERAQAMDNISRLLITYYDTTRDVQHTLQRLEDKMTSLEGLSDVVLLDRLKVLLEEANDLHHQFDQVRDSANQLLSNASPDSDIDHISEEVTTLEDRHKHLIKTLEDRCAQLEFATNVLLDFMNKEKKVHQDLRSVEEELDNMAPVARVITTVQTQIVGIKDYMGLLEKVNDDIEDVCQQGENLIHQGYVTDIIACREKLENIRQQFSRTEEQAKVRYTILESSLAQLERFYEDYSDTMTELDKAIKEEKNFKIISGEVETIRSLQEEFKIFRRTHIEPLSKQITDVNKLGQGLVQSAMPGVDTTKLEQDMETLNEKWNNLKERLNDRERLLDLTLLQSGKFQEALEGVQKWLQDTEEMISNQRAPSADYKVVKAQLQEQKFLRKLLLDRQNSMTSLSDMGTEIMQNLELTEQKQITVQLNYLTERFNILITEARERMEVLEKTIPVAQDFQDKIGPLLVWLERVEKRLVIMTTIPIDQDKIRKQITEHKELHEDIINQKTLFDELNDVGETLVTLVSEEEAYTIREKFQDTNYRYVKVREDSESIGRMLIQALEGMGSFLINCEKLLTWLQEVDNKLSRYQILSVYVDKLQEQIDELTVLRSEIESHQWEVESLLTAAQEIMRHASGDDAVQMKDKADTIQSKFNEVSQRCNERQKQALEVLPLTQNFHSSHEQLVFWMDETERILKTLESLSLSTQETTITQLEKEIHEYRPLVESVSSLGPRLCQISPGEGSHLLETLVTRDNRRYDAICEQVQRKAERIQLSKQKNSEVMADIDELLEWFRGTQQKVKDAEPLYPDPDTLTGLVKEQKVVNEDVSGQKSRVRDILATAKKLMREMSTEDLSLIREKADELKDLSSCVSTMCIDRMSALEQALPLAEHFFETHIDLIQWLDEAEAEAELLETPTLNVPQIKRQQDKTQELLQSLNEHKPLVDKLNKTGSALLKLCGDEEGSKVQEIMDSDNSRYNSLRGLIRNRQNTLEEALQATSQFSDKLDGMLQALSTTVDQLGNAEPISAHPERIVEQITDNKNVLEDLAKRSTALEAVKRAADDVITKAGKDQPAVEDIRQKLDRLNDLWDNIQKSTKNRGRSLEDALTVAEKFWDELNAVMKALKELQENLNAQDPPAIEPSAIQEQQEALQEIKQEIDQTRPEVDQCRQVGQDLMQLCGEPDKPEVKKHIEDLDSAWENVTTLYAKREQNLVDAMEKAMSFHFTLQNLLEFLDNAEEQFTNLGPVGSDIDAVKSQIAQLKEFKTEVDPHMVEIEALNRQAQELVERTSPDQALAIREPLAEINRRWDNLLRGIVERQQELENALLKLGQFQHALDELLSWITRTERTLTDLKPVAGDPQVIEVELAKHKVLVNDIQAHQSSIDTINRVGHQLVDTDHGSEDANVTQKKMNDLNIRWQQLQDKAIERQKELEAALKEAVAFNQEIQDLLLWLSDVDSQLATSKPVGGLPETAKEQLNRFMELYNELDLNRHKVETVLQQGQDYLKRTNEDTTTNLQHNLKILKQRWDSVLNKANDRKIKLEIALREATQFHEALQEFVDWLTNAEKYLTSMKPVSRVMETVMEQIKDHKSFQKDLGSHREVMLNLDKKGTHLKYFSQKQDVILIKNLLISVQHRWERVVSKAAERTRMLDHGYKEAKEFYDAWSELISWLDEAKATLDSLTHIGKDPDKIKQLLNKHKEFQRALGAKQSKYDTTMKIGRILKDRCPKSDLPGLQEMIDELKNKWNAVCNKSVNRQRELEEALLYSGQFKDAVVALFDWLDRAKGVLAIEQPIQGDLDTVTSLVDQHKTFQNELHNRANNLDSVRRTAGGLLQTATPEEMQHIHSQVNHLDEKWEELIKLSNEKQQRLDEALQKAELLHKSVHILLEWLSDAEIKLRFTGPLPDDEETTRQQIIEHQNFLDQLKEQEDNKDKTLVLAQEILQHCHPDGITIIRHWITIIQSRWEEIFVWARQRDQKLQDHLRSLRDITDLLDELMKWLLGAEATLTALEAEPLSDDVPVLEQLITDHQDFMADMTKRQPEIDQITKAFSSKRQPPKQSYHPPHRVKGGRHEDRRPSRGVGATGPKTSTPSKPYSDPEIKNPRARDLLDKWRNVWLLAMERQRRLQDKLNYLRELERIKNFNFDDWRRRFLGWMNNKKSRIMDLFRKIDKNNDGRVTRAEFIDGILKSKFPTSRLEMERVAEIFDVNGDGFIDNKEYIDTLRPDREGRPKTDAEKIQDEVQRQVAKCLCVHKFKVYQVGEGKYRFGDSQKLRLVRILRSTVMVHVGGGWVALDEFLVKNDPCRAPFLLMRCLPVQGVLEPSFYRPVPSDSNSRIPVYCWVREKSERSTPLQQRRTSGTADTSSESGPSFSETDSFGARSGRPWLTPTTHRGSPSGTKTSSRPTSRNGSHPSSRPSSKPPSRAGSDLSTDSVEAYRSARRTPVGNTKIPASTGRQRTPSGSSQTSATKSASSTPGTRIPTVRKTSSGGRADGIKGKEKWK